MMRTALPLRPWEGDPENRKVSPVVAFLERTLSLYLYLAIR